MEIQEQVALAPYTTFGIGGPARWFAHIKNSFDVPYAIQWARERNMRWFVLGGGSNLLVPDEGFDGLVLYMDNRGISLDKDWSPDFTVDAGEPWDKFVQYSINFGCSGIECLAGIPGSTGGTPVQNVGAYGQEVSQTIYSVHVFDTQAMEFRNLNREECGFRYRGSIFNTTEQGRYVVISVSFSLRGSKQVEPTYGELAKMFEGRSKSPTVREVADAVRDIRRAKGMLIVEGDADCRSAGSFFKNPVLPVEQAERVAASAGLRLDEIPHWPAGAGLTKLPAAWLLERAGFVKGFGTGPVGISTKHTLALTNRGGASFADVLHLQDKIVTGVEQKFGVRLEREPVVMEAV